MKKLFKITIIAFVAMISMESVASAQLLKNLLKQVTSSSTATTTSAAYTQGQTAGSALKSLYAQYKLDGKKLNMDNATNILSVASLAGSVKELKSTDLSYKVLLCGQQTTNEDNILEPFQKLSFFLPYYNSTPVINAKNSTSALNCSISLTGILEIGLSGISLATNETISVLSLFNVMSQYPFVLTTS